MRITERDLKLLHEIAMHSVLSRDQVIALGFFKSVPRANARLGGLYRVGLLGRAQLEPTLAFVQSLYYVRKAAIEFLDERVANLVAARKLCPTFIQHALMVVNVRLVLERCGGADWLHECQIRHRYKVNSGQEEDFRPDGMMTFGHTMLFIEADRGNASLKRIKGKLETYENYVDHGLFQQTYGASSLALLFVTTGYRRSRSVYEIARDSNIRVSIRTTSQMSNLSSIAEILR